MVTRRYYRSGESEYYINRRSVRLKDVNELFMDTGLGREGYSIIGQGRIDEILSVKSADRREVFEEAAGISRFRHRKEEAERKLERTQENLVRITDKIDELELQVEPLRARARRPGNSWSCGTSCGGWRSPCAGAVGEHTGGGHQDPVRLRERRPPEGGGPGAVEASTPPPRSTPPGCGTRTWRPRASASR